MRSGAGSEAKREVERVGLVDHDPLGAEAFAQPRGEVAVDLDHVQRAHARARAPR